MRIKLTDRSTLGRPGPELTPRERRMRRWLMVLAMALALAVVAVGVIVVYWRLYLLGPTGSPFTRGPYLVRVDADQALLRWRVDAGQAVELVAVDPEGRTLTGRGGRITALRPGTRYQWTASVGDDGRASGSFTTPSADPDRAVRFAVTADYGDGSDDQWAVARTMAAGRPDFVLTAGDNSYISAADILLDRNIFRPMAELLRNAPMYVGLGDHDLLPPGDEAIRRAFDLPPSGRYVLRLGTVQVVVLGDNTGGQGVAFTRDALGESGFTRRFVVVHKPIQPGNPILPVLRGGDVDAVFSGNLHRYERRTVGGVRTFTVGTGGAGAGSDEEEFTPPSKDADLTLEGFGHLVVDVTPSRVAYSFVDKRGRVLDRTSAR